MPAPTAWPISPLIATPFANALILADGFFNGKSWTARNNLITSGTPDDPRIPYGTLWALDLAKNTWTQAASGPKARLNLGSMTYDPRLNLAITRSGSALWVYRHKGGCPAGAFQ